MELRLYKYHDIENSKKLDLIGVVDDCISVVFTRSWAGIGEWHVKMSNHSPHIQWFYEAQFIRFHHFAAGLINKANSIINEEEETTTFNGVELKGLASLRVIDPREYDKTKYDYPENLKKYLLEQNISSPSNTNRTIPCVVNIARYWGGGSSPGKTSYNPVYDNLGEVLTRLSTTYNDGWYADITTYSEIIDYKRTKNMICFQRESRTDTDCNVVVGKYYNNYNQLLTDSNYQCAGFELGKLIPVETGKTYYLYGWNTDSTSHGVYINGYAVPAGSNQTVYIRNLGQTTAAANSSYELSITIPEVQGATISLVRASFGAKDIEVMFEEAPKTSHRNYYEPVYDSGIGVCFFPGLQHYDCTKNRTVPNIPLGNPIVISRNTDTLSSSEIDIEKYLPNTAYVAGQGQGEDRAIAIVNENDAKRLDRYEILVDARDVVEESSLPARGLEYLSRYGNNLSYICEAGGSIIERYKPQLANDGLPPYGTWWRDVSIGNIVTISDDELGIEQDVQITEITEVYDEDDGFRLELKFGENTSNLIDNMSLIAARTDSLLKQEPAILQYSDGRNYLRYWFGIKDGLYPKLKLLPSLQDDPTNTRGEQSIEGSYYGCISLQAWNVLDNSNNRRGLYLYDSSAQSNVNNALKLRDWTNGTSIDYTLVHSGNVIDYISGYTGNITSTGTIQAATLKATSSITTPTLSATGAISGASVSATGTISAKNITATSSISGASMSATGSISAPTINATTVVNTKKVHIEDGYYPMFELKPTANSVTKVHRVEGSYAGDISMQAWADSSGNNRTILSIYDPVERSSLTNRLQLRECVNGTWKTYNIFHAGNLTFPNMVIWTNSSSDWSKIQTTYGGSWVSVGSITCGGKTLYAYQRNS